jgi:hypothetical protein
MVAIEKAMCSWLPPVIKGFLLVETTALLVCNRLSSHAPGLDAMKSRVALGFGPGCGSKNGLSCTQTLYIAAYFATDPERTDYTVVAWQK